MKNINIETNYVRVIGNTRNPNIAEMNKMVGQELEVQLSSYEDNEISVWNEDKSNYYYFKKSGVRFLTPAMFNGNHVAIDDEVLISGGWKKVIGFYIYDNQIRLLTGTLESTSYWDESEITDYRTETLETKMTIKQIEEKLNITGLKIIE